MEFQRSLTLAGETLTKKRQPKGCLFNLRTLKVGLLVPSFWLFPGPPSSRLVSRFRTRICSCIGLPRHSTFDSFPSSSKCSCCSVDPLALLFFATGSAFASTAPDYWRSLGAPFAGRLSTSELAGAEAFASSLTLSLAARITKCFFCNQIAKNPTT